MTKQFKLSVVLANALLSLLYVISSYRLWEELNNWYGWNMQATWTPFYVYPHRIPDLPTVLMVVPTILNLPFIIFLIIIVTNCVMLATYFFVLPRLQRRADRLQKKATESI